MSYPSRYTAPTAVDDLHRKGNCPDEKAASQSACKVLLEAIQRCIGEVIPAEDTTFLRLDLDAIMKNIRENDTDPSFQIIDHLRTVFLAAKSDILALLRDKLGEAAQGHNDEVEILWTELLSCLQRYGQEEYSPVFSAAA